MLCPFNRLLKDALKEHRAVGAFNVGNLEMLLGIIKAAEESQTPVILQIAEKRFTHSPLEYIAPMLHAAAMRAKIEVADIENSSNPKPSNNGAAIGSPAISPHIPAIFLLYVLIQ